MNLRILLICGLTACMLWLGWRVTRSQPAVASPTPPVAQDIPLTPIPVELLPEKYDPPTPSRPARAPAPHGQAALEAIQTAAATHDASMIPLLARYLESDAADVRAAAIQGLIELGERDAIPYLKIAAQETKISEEKTELLKAAEFLSLPTWKEHRASIKANLPAQPGS